jgi:hypothetical protein
MNGSGRLNGFVGAGLMSELLGAVHHKPDSGCPRVGCMGRIWIELHMH